MADGFRIAKAYVEVGPDTEGFREKVQEQLDEAMAGVRANAKIGADDADLNAKVDEIKAKLDELGGRHVDPSIGLETGDFDGKRDEAIAKLDEMDAKTARPKLGLDDSEFKAKLASDKAAADSAGGGGEGGGFPGGLLGALTVGITGLLPGIGPAVAGMGLLAGTGLAAFGGIGKALAAHSQASQNVGITGQQMALTSFTNAVAVQQAQFAISQAYAQSAEQAKASSMAIIQANQQVGLSEQSLKDAQFGEQQAQINLTMARIQARLTLQQLNNAEKDSVLATKSAKLALAQAEYQQRLTDQNAMTTSLDRQQAALAVAQAQRQVVEAQQNQVNSAQAADRANKLGVNGSQAVVQAEHAVLDAVNAVKDGRMQYADAIRQAAFTQQQAAFQQKQADIAIQQAQQNLSNTLKTQQLQWAATMSTSNQAANQFAKDMSRLSAPARDLVRQLLSMHGAIKLIESIAQGAILPGMTMFLRGIKSILPEINSGVRQMGRAMSTSFGNFGKLMQTPAFKQGFAGLLRNGVQFANIVLPAFARFLQQLGKLGGQKGAVSGLANLLGGLGDGLANVAKALSPFTGALSSVFTTLGQALKPVGTLLGQVIGSLGKALAPGLKAMLPGFDALVSALGTGLVTALTSLGPLLKPVGQAISIVVTALAPLLPAAGKIIGQFAHALTPVLTDMLPMIRSLAGLLSQNLMTGLTQTFSAVLPLIPAIGNLIISMTPIIKLVTDVAGWLLTFSADLTGPVTNAVVWLLAKIINFAAKWQVAFKAVEKASLWLWHNILDPMWHGIETGAANLYNNAILPYFNLIKLAFGGVETAALWLWHNVFDPVWHGIMAGVHAFERGFSTVWGRIEGIFKTPVNFLIGTVYDNGIRRFWNDIVGHIGLSSLELPEIPKLARGGIVPGRDTGHDNQLVAMRSGEGVLVPEAVQAIGPGTVHALNNTFGAGGSRSSDGSAGFGHGGIFGDIGGFFTGLGHDIMSGARFAAQFATNPVAAVTTLLSKVIGTPATGNLGKVMTGIPRTLIHDMASLVAGSGSKAGPGGGTSAPVHATGTVASWFKQAIKLTGVPLSWMTDLETIGWYESRDNANAINLWDSNAKAGDPSRGIMQTIMSTFMAYHQPGTSNDIYNPVANIASAIRYIKANYGTPAGTPGIISLARGGGYKGYDSGGWLMPGTMPVNGTGRPEAVLTPAQSQALQALARWAEQTMGQGGPAGLGGVNFNYFGTQYPGVEQRALQRRDLALALSGAH